jgi:hypothetical protein
MKTGGNGLGADDVAPDQGHVLLLVAVVPESHDAELAEPGGKIRDRDHPDADLHRPDAVAFVLPIPGHQILERSYFYHCAPA